MDKVVKGSVDQNACIVSGIRMDECGTSGTASVNWYLRRNEMGDLEIKQRILDYDQNEL